MDAVRRTFQRIPFLLPFLHLVSADEVPVHTDHQNQQQRREKHKRLRQHISERGMSAFHV